jgi:Rubredoxin.
MTRKNESGFAALNDNWRCPICNADARPGLLIVDKYFLAVREFLVMTNTIEGATAIQVKADGSWTLRAIRDESPNVPRSSRANKTPDPVLGKRKGDDDMGQGSDAIRPKLEPFPARRISQASAEPVVIELE